MPSNNTTKARSGGIARRKKPAEIVRATSKFLPFACDLTRLFACVECWKAAVHHSKKFVSRECQSVAKGVPLQGLWPAEQDVAQTWLFAATVTRSACKAHGLNYDYYKKDLLPRATNAMQWLFGASATTTITTTTTTTAFSTTAIASTTVTTSSPAPLPTTTTSSAAPSSTSSAATTTTAAPSSSATTSSTTSTTTTSSPPSSNSITPTRPSKEAIAQERQNKKLEQKAKKEKRAHELAVKKKRAEHDKMMNELAGVFKKLAIEEDEEELELCE